MKRPDEAIERIMDVSIETPSVNVGDLVDVMEYLDWLEEQGRARREPRMELASPRPLQLDEHGHTGDSY